MDVISSAPGAADSVLGAASQLSGDRFWVAAGEYLHLCSADRYLGIAAVGLLAVIVGNLSEHPGLLYCDPDGARVGLDFARFDQRWPAVDQHSLFYAVAADGDDYPRRMATTANAVRSRGLSTVWAGDFFAFVDCWFGVWHP